MYWYFENLGEAILWVRRELNRRSRRYFGLRETLDLARAYVEIRDGGYWVSDDAPDKIFESVN